MPRNRPQTEHRIREAARRLLREQGFAAWGVNALARAAHVDKVLIYRYFTSMDDLLDELAGATEFWPDPEGLPSHAPEAFLRAAIAHVEADPLRWVLLGDPRARRRGSAIRRQYDRGRERWLAGLRRLVEGPGSGEALDRLAALIENPLLHGQSPASPSALWMSVSPPLQWRREPAAEADGGLPTALL
jgi:AcrR family transcriptional regulator